MKNKPQFVAGLELGERHFIMAVGHRDEQGRIVVQAADLIPAQGIERGVLTDPVECSDAVARLARKVEAVLGTRVPKVLVAVHGNHLKSYNSNSSIPIPDPGVGISPRDVEKAITTCRTLSLDYDRQVLHTFRRGFAVDGQSGIKDPVGLYGTKLSVELHMVTALNLAMQNLVRVLNRAGLEVQEFMLPSLACAEAVLSELDQDLGVTLIRIGVLQSEAILFADGGVKETFLVPWGTEHLAESLSRALKMPRVSVEQLLGQIRGVEDRPEWSAVPLQVRAGTLVRNFPHGQVTHLLTARAKEFFTRLRQRLDSSPYFQESAAGVVMVGPLTRLEGFLEMAESFLNTPVRMGTAREVEVNPQVTLNSMHSTAVGLIRHALKGQEMASNNHRAGSPLVRWVEKTRKVLEDYF